MDITEKIQQFLGEAADTQNSRIEGELGAGPGEKTMWKEFQKYWQLLFGEIPSAKALKDLDSSVAKGWEQYKKGRRMK